MWNNSIPFCPCSPYWMNAQSSSRNKKPFLMGATEKAAVRTV